ncbi:MAG: type II secretion system F family protein [Devosia nanyangense]|uniref:Type II secretion system F family protein n=1 Tax=Devosia nanyangense TaxID=1228055 RepID=A0A933NVT3_9HYPH|nr:type II secretion system F family protein [Devosia nanyangense]
MDVLVYVMLAVVGVGAVGFALVPGLVGSSRADKRMKALQGDIQANRRDADVVRTRDSRRKQIAETLKQQNEALGKARRRVPLQDQIYQAGMKIKARDFIRNQIIVGLIIVVICFVLQVPLLFLPVFGIAGGYLLPKLYLGRRRKKHQNAYLEELPNAVEAIVRGVKSGLPLNDSMRLVAKEAKEPIKTEFQRVLDQQSLGKSTTDAVQIMFDRMPLAEVNFFVVVITVQQQAGGNLSEALGNLSRVLRNRKKMKQKIKAMSSEAKASAGIIGSLPFIVGILVSLTTPSYMVPLFTTTIGQIWLGIAVIMMSFGVWVMSRMIQFDF